MSQRQTVCYGSVLRPANQMRLSSTQLRPLPEVPGRGRRMAVPKDDEVLVRVFATTVTRTDTGSGARVHHQLVRHRVAQPRSGSGIERRRGWWRRPGRPSSSLSATASSRPRAARTPSIRLRPRGRRARHMPDGMSFDRRCRERDGVALALARLRTAGPLEGRRVLVYRASGAVGTRQYSSPAPRRRESLRSPTRRPSSSSRSLGADEVVDYPKEELPEARQVLRRRVRRVGSTRSGGRGADSSRRHVREMISDRCGTSTARAAHALDQKQASPDRDHEARQRRTYSS